MSQAPQCPSAVSSADLAAGLRVEATQESVLAESLISSRQSILPKRLFAPGPSPQQTEQLFGAAAAAPDHGELTPWRFVMVPDGRRADLADVFAQALMERDASATQEQLEAAREKAFRAPWLALAVARLGPRDPDIATPERLVSLGCAIQNILLRAHSMSFGSGLTSGQAMTSPPLRSLFGLQPDEQAVCFINVGTVTKRKAPRLRPAPFEFVSSL